MKNKKRLNYVTLLWDELPESGSVFVIPRVFISKADIKTLKACNNVYISGYGALKEHENYELLRLSSMIVDPENKWVNDSYKSDLKRDLRISDNEVDELVGKWYPFKLDMDKPRTIPRSKLFRSGYYV